ncbi:hypothetical protein FA95DRAFT_1335548 [Auriscalpium vulgare]|uniref:Uncharacterized protein n=1 Tax=Auriscalpium vulgare TaxID=40419 RepID=A0ACB8RRY3_9AGAM|nr:hypothetical protein FA95DRAFT_1335548 [Auriscalpium vulgare]
MPARTPDTPGFVTSAAHQYLTSLKSASALIESRGPPGVRDWWRGALVDGIKFDQPAHVPRKRRSRCARRCEHLDSTASAWAYFAYTWADCVCHAGGRRWQRTSRGVRAASHGRSDLPFSSRSPALTYGPMPGTPRVRHIVKRAAGAVRVVRGAMNINVPWAPEGATIY